MKRQLLCTLLSGMLVSVCGTIGPYPVRALPPMAQGLHDLVVIPPDAHERMLPAVELEGWEGISQIRIPETLHIHRYYYSGDKEIQGPILQGGPTMIVANHPFCGERMYVQAVLPSGAPRIAYTGHAITYVYPNQRVMIRFHRLGAKKVSIHFVSGKGLARKHQQARETVKRATVEKLQGSNLVQSVHETVSESHQFAKGAGATVGGILGGVIDGGRALLHTIPGVVPLKSLGDQTAERTRDAKIRHDVLELERAETPFATSNRN